MGKYVEVNKCIRSKDSKFGKAGTIVGYCTLVDGVVDLTVPAGATEIEGYCNASVAYPEHMLFLAESKRWLIAAKST